MVCFNCPTRAAAAVVTGTLGNDTVDPKEANDYDIHGPSGLLNLTRCESGAQVGAPRGRLPVGVARSIPSDCGSVPPASQTAAPTVSAALLACCTLSSLAGVRVEADVSWRLRVPRGGCRWPRAPRSRRPRHVLWREWATDPPWEAGRLASATVRTHARTHPFCVRRIACRSNP